MIIFEGVLSENCKQYMLRENKKGGFISAWIASALLLIPIVFLSIFWQWIVIVFAIPLLSAPFLAKLPLAEKDQGLLYPSRIEIDVQEDPPLLLAKSEKFHVVRDVTQIKHIIDMENWYVFIFFFPHKSEHFVCEKRLLCQGSLEEFEKLFEGKIKRESEV